MYLYVPTFTSKPKPKLSKPICHKCFAQLSATPKEVLEMCHNKKNLDEFSTFIDCCQIRPPVAEDFAATLNISFPVPGKFNRKTLLIRNTKFVHNLALSVLSV